MQAKLVVVGGDAKATEIRLKLPTIIGRGREAGLTLPHPLVSRQHCEIVESNGQLMVRDMGSLNGTFVGNERINGEALLPPGELLTVGTVTFRAVYELAAGTEAPASGRDDTLENEPIGPIPFIEPDSTLPAPLPTRPDESTEMVPPAVAEIAAPEFTPAPPEAVAPEPEPALTPEPASTPEPPHSEPVPTEAFTPNPEPVVEPEPVDPEPEPAAPAPAVPVPAAAEEPDEVMDFAPADVEEIEFELAEDPDDVEPPATPTATISAVPTETSSRLDAPSLPLATPTTAPMPKADPAPVDSGADASAESNGQSGGAPSGAASDNGQANAASNPVASTDEPIDEVEVVDSSPSLGPPAAPDNEQDEVMDVEEVEALAEDAEPEPAAPRFDMDQLEAVLANPESDDDSDEAAAPSDDDDELNAFLKGFNG